MPRSKRNPDATPAEKPKATPKPPEPAASGLTPPIVGGDPMPERPEPLPPIPEAAIKALATELARSQGIRRPTSAQLHFNTPVSYSRLAELIIIGFLFVAREGIDVE